MAVCSPLPPSQHHNEINIKSAMATHITTDHNSIPPKFTTFTLTASPFHNQIIHYHHKQPVRASQCPAHHDAAKKPSRRRPKSQAASSVHTQQTSSPPPPP
ncbi:hypothetical protein M0R45_024891 [Rubus argutus]|uniref:Uncharacterized protein n=1 Tax=Rubus argutus TaxID=59490 RepID=A0AAW1WWE1_RUBAR